MVSEKLTKVIR